MIWKLNNRKNGQYLCDVYKRLASDFPITNAFKLQTVAVRQDKSGIGKVKVAFLEITMPL